MKRNFMKQEFIITSLLFEEAVLKTQKDNWRNSL